MTKDVPAILVVDDEADICHNLSDILTDLGYQVDTAQNGTAALELVRQRRYDVAVLDLMMPGMDGMELFSEIEKFQAGTVALLVTAYPTHPRAEEARAAGIWQVLPKPVDLPRLLAQIEEATGQPLVLVVDDDPALCQNLWDLLRERGYRVSIAHDEQRATDRLRENGFNVILLDMKLPDGSGASIFHKAQQANPEAKVIVITGHPEEMEPAVGELLARGARAFLPKPFDVPRLLETLERLARDAKK